MSEPTALEIAQSITRDRERDGRVRLPNGPAYKMARAVCDLTAERDALKAEVESERTFAMQLRDEGKFLKRELKDVIVERDRLLARLARAEAAIEAVQCLAEDDRRNRTCWCSAKHNNDPSMMVGDHTWPCAQMQKALQAWDAGEAASEKADPCDPAAGVAQSPQPQRRSTPR